MLGTIIHDLICSFQQSYEIDTIIMPIFLMRKLRHRVVK